MRISITLILVMFMTFDLSNSERKIDRLESKIEYLEREINKTNKLLQEAISLQKENM